MIPTTLQSKAIDLTVQKYKNGDKKIVIAGPAGTGKTSTVKFIVEALLNLDRDKKVSKEDIIFCSYTGKATLVLRQKGNENAITLHKLLYDSIPREDGTFRRIPVSRIGYKIIIIDECSMVPKNMVDLLLSYPNIFCIFLGDNAQLPPVDKNADNHLLDNPDIYLNEILRQAAESDIIQLSIAIREGKPIKPYKSKDVIVMTKKDFTTGVMTWGDQLLCATNRTRTALNNQFRRIQGRGTEPEDGDRLICLHNYDDRISMQDNFPLVNGTTGTLHLPYKTFVRFSKYINPSIKNPQIDVLMGEFTMDGGNSFGRINIDYNELMTGERCLDPRTIYMLSKQRRYGPRFIPCEFAFGYAITVWKAQGSEWGKVVILEEDFPRTREDHQRYLYTGVTRASDKVVLVLNE